MAESSAKCDVCDRRFYDDGTATKCPECGTVYPSASVDLIEEWERLEDGVPDFTAVGETSIGDGFGEIVARGMDETTREWMIWTRDHSTDIREAVRALRTRVAELETGE